MEHGGGGSALEWRRGWKQLLVAVTGSALGCTGLFLYSQGLFIKPLQDAFGWSRGEVSAMSGIFSLSLALIAPIYGLLLDRFGVKPVTAISILCFSAGYWMLSRIQGDLTVFYLTILFLAVLGGGTASMSYVRLVGGWFEKARGLAIGITTTGAGVTALVLPPLLAGYMQLHGWRAAFQVLAVLALMMLPLVLFVAREKPHAAHDASAAAPGMTLGEAMRTRRFWQLGLTFGFAGAAVTGLLTHFVPMLQDAGMTLAQAGATFGVIGLTIIIGRLLTGFLCDHFFAPYISAIVFLLAAAGCLGLMLFGVDFAVVAGAMIGLGLGAEIDLVGYMSARYFGLRAYGAVIGVQYGLFSLGASTAPVVNGILYDRFGSYDVPLLLAAGVLLLAIPSVVTLGRYPQLKQD